MPGARWGSSSNTWRRSTPRAASSSWPFLPAARVTHAALNKDRGLIDPATGDATAPTTPRGLVEDNFAKAVAGAVAETRRQWQDFRSELADRYGRERAEMMICALTNDDPVNDWPDRPLVSRDSISFT
jgi:hypothetical protein